MYVFFSSEFGDIVIAWKQPVQSYKIVYCKKKRHTHLLCRTVYVFVQFCFCRLFCPVSSSSSVNLNTILLCGPCFFFLFFYTPVMAIYCTGHSHVSCLYNFLTVVTVQASAVHSVFTSPLIDLYRPLEFYRLLSFSLQVHFSVGATAFVVFTGLCLCRPLCVHGPVFVLICLSSGLEQI